MAASHALSYCAKLGCRRRPKTSSPGPQKAESVRTPSPHTGGNDRCGSAAIHRFVRHPAIAQQEDHAGLFARRGIGAHEAALAGRAPAGTPPRGSGRHSSSRSATAGSSRSNSVEVLGMKYSCTPRPDRVLRLVAVGVKAQLQPVPAGRCGRLPPARYGAFIADQRGEALDRRRSRAARPDHRRGDGHAAARRRRPAPAAACDARRASGSGCSWR